MPTMQEIRDRYPSPVTSETRYGHSRKGCYCVGGAVALYVLHTLTTSSPRAEDHSVLVRFPEAQDLRHYLIDLNENLPREVAAEYADEIICYNDDGAFEAAWFTLNLALTYTED
jgi:hypothetical protein